MSKEIDRLITQIEESYLGYDYDETDRAYHSPSKESCSGWLKSSYINSSGCEYDINDIKEAFPEIDNIPNEKIAPLLATAIFKYWCGGESYDRDQDTLQRLKTEFSKGGLTPWWSDDPIDEAGPIAYYVLKKLGIKCPNLSDDEEKTEWFNQALFDACNPSEDADDNSFESEKVVTQKETPKKKKRFFGLF